MADTETNKKGGPSTVDDPSLPAPIAGVHFEDNTAQHLQSGTSHSIEHEEKRDSVTNEHLDSVVLDEQSCLNERMRQVESKIALVDVMYGLHEQTADALKYGDMDPPRLGYWESEAQENFENLNFYKDIAFFMRRIRRTHQKLVGFDRQRKDVAEAALKKMRGRTSESETMRLVSTEAILKEKRAKVMQVGWDAFVLPKENIEDSILTPIDVVIGEPESRIILQLTSIIGKKKKKGKLSLLLGVERVLPAEYDGEALEQQPLPERIKVHSAPLLAIFEQFEKGLPWETSEDRSLVFLRPYQDLIYYEPQLREWLASLEKRFENFEKEQNNPIVADVQGEGEDDTSTKSPLTQDSSLSGPNLQSPSKNEPKKDGSPGSKPVDEDGDDDDNVEREDEETDGQRFSNSITALLHLRCLMEFMDTEIKPKQKHISSPRCNRIHFHDLWHLFKPGDEVIDHNEKQAYVVLRVQVPRHKVEEPWERWNKRVPDDSSDDEGDKEENGSPFTLHCFYIDFDGKTFGPVSKRFKVSPFGDLKPIRSLPVYPIRFAKGSRTRENLITRGQLLLDVSKFKSMYYMGTTLDKRDEIDSQVVIDFSEALADETRRKAWEPTIGSINTAPDDQDDNCVAACCHNKIIREGFEVDSRMTEDYIKTLVPDTSLRPPSLVLSPRSLEDTLSSVTELTETEFLVMTYRVFGFVLRSRKWAQLDLTLVRHENSDARNLTVNAFERLELPEGHSEMVKSLVVQHFRSKQSGFSRDEQTDLIQGKGKGLILLLHGAPGVGKTTTAEGIAELFRKPLFQITCGDLGTTAREVETELEKNFALASRWGCILLLDEADVFLSARERMDFKRNGLVAVFLRVLEYYTGILFLTTNRIGDFDEAFASRIHMSLYYPELDEDKTLKVFKLNLDLIQQRFSKQGRSIIFDTSSVDDFAQQHFRQHKYNRWNGRQIRNACQTALALAEFDSQGGTLEMDSKVDKSVVVKLELKYFKTVQRAYLDFDHYLGDIQGTQGDRRAIDYKLRARTDTPYQTKRSRFSEREDSRAATGQNLHPQYPHTQRNFSATPQSSFGSQIDPFSQNYQPTTPNAGMAQSQGYGQYSTQSNQLSSYQEQQRPGYVGDHGPHERQRSFGQSEGIQQAQMDTRLFHGQQQGQHFDTSNIGQFSYGAEAARHTERSYDGSTLPNRAVQLQQSQDGYGNANQGAGSHSPAIPMQSTPMHGPHSIFRDGQQGPSDIMPSKSE